MTEVSNDGSISGLVAANSVEQVRDNAQNLTQSWGLRFATVSSIDASDPNVAMVLFDDSSSAVVPALSLGGSVAAGDRVTIIQVPPSGTYILNKLPGNFYERRQILTSTTSSVTFSNIPTRLRRLEVHYTARGTGAFSVNQMYYRINGVSSASYYAQRLMGNNATASAAPDNPLTRGPLGLLTGALATTNVYGSGQAVFVSWDSPNSGSLSSTFLSQSIGAGVGASNFFLFAGGGMYFADGPYTSLTLLPETGSFESGSDFQITGWYA